jgi:hypothetical protein
MAKSLLERFWSKVDKSGDCWLWTGTINRRPDGYGVIGSADGTRYVHRLSYELAFGPVPDGMNVCHTCDVRTCVNPAHLFAGTQLDNIHDMIRKGRRRSYDRHGARNPRAVMTEERVRELRALRRAGMTLARLAERFGIGTTQASRIARGEQWPEEMGIDAA